MMMKKLLVPVDFTDQSINAFRFAQDIARQSNGIIQLLHVIPLPVIHDSPLLPVADLKKQLLEEMTAAVQQKFLRLVQDYSVENIKISTHVVSGPINSSILEFIRDAKTDLVVMGTKGVTGLREWMIGSNTEKIVRTSPVPIVAVKKYGRGRPIKNIIFPNTLDTGNQEPLILKIKALQNFFEAILHIVWINTAITGSKQDTEIREKLKAFAKRYMLKDYTIHVFHSSDEESGIIEFTKQMKGDLIAIGTRGFTGLAHLITGSIAEDVVNHAQHPVWTYSTKPSKSTSNQQLKWSGWR